MTWKTSYIPGNVNPGLLLTVSTGSEERRFSATDYASTYQWHGVISGIDPVRMSMKTKHGGFLKITAGQIRFVASAFGSVNLWSLSDWPPPKELTGVFQCKAQGQEEEIFLFEAMLYRARIDELEVAYDVYISSHDDTIASGTNLATWPTTNTLTGFFEKVCDVLDLTLDSSKANADPPSVSHVLSTERLVIDVADDVSAFCSHCFWISDGTLYLQDMSEGNGTLNLENPNDYFRSPEYVDEIPVNRVAAESHEYVGSDYPYGTDSELSVNYTGDDSQLQKIYNLLNAQWAEVPMSVEVGGGEFLPGKVMTLLDSRLPVDSESTIKMRSVSYDFMGRKIIIGGHCSMGAA